MSESSLKELTPLGVGVGLRPPHYGQILSERPRVSWFEATSENYMGLRNGLGGRPLDVLERVRAHYPVMLHGVSMNIGSCDPLRQSYLETLRALADRIQPEEVSDHLCWTGVEGENLHDLLPLPFTEETIRHVSARISQAQEILGRRLAFENVSSYLTFKQSEMSEWEFLTEIAMRTGCRILLDVNNVYVSATNHGFDPLSFIEGIPAERVAYIHLAGYQDQGGLLIDTHDHAVTPPVWDLYAAAIRRLGPTPTLIEWDDHIPPLEQLLAEARLAETVQRRVLAESGRTPAGIA